MKRHADDSCRFKFSLSSRLLDLLCREAMRWTGCELDDAMQSVCTCYITFIHCIPFDTTKALLIHPYVLYESLAIFIVLSLYKDWVLLDYGEKSTYTLHCRGCSVQPPLSFPSLPSFSLAQMTILTPCLRRPVPATFDCRNMSVLAWTYGMFIKIVL